MAESADIGAGNLIGEIQREIPSQGDREQRKAIALEMWGDVEMGVYCVIYMCHTVNLCLVSIKYKNPYWKRGNINPVHKITTHDFITPFGNILFPMLTAEWLHLIMYLSTEYHNSGLNIIILLENI